MRLSKCREGGGTATPLLQQGSLWETETYRFPLRLSGSPSISSQNHPIWRRASKTFLRLSTLARMRLNWAILAISKVAVITAI